MNELADVIREHFPKDRIEDMEQNYPMYKALEYLQESLRNKEIFLPLIIANSMVCYQLSHSGESYWEELANEASQYEFVKLRDIYLFFLDFLPGPNGSKRPVNTKAYRLEKLDHALSDFYFKQRFYQKNKMDLLKKLDDFLSDFFYKQKFYQNNMVKFKRDLTKIMQLAENTKTVSLTVKMFGYGARIRFGKYVEFPKEIPMPIDNEIRIIYKELNDNPDTSIEEFYRKLSEILDIAPLHLHSILSLHHTFLIDETLKRKEKNGQ